MREIGIAGAILSVLVLVGTLAYLPFRGVLLVGAWMIGSGFVVGVPAGFVYHVLLRRTLKPRGELPVGWYWHPIELNKKLRPYDRVRVLTWCYLGGAAFFVLGIGLVMFVMGMMSGMAQLP